MSKKDLVEVDKKEQKDKDEVYISKVVDRLYKKTRRRKIIFTVVLVLFVLNVMLYIGISMNQKEKHPVKIAVSKNQTSAHR